eukprot:CAMPEP_0198205178 /NCGR_PEP_ID=MMETSP1445-20131203/8669_1 /TAXON_ID=36898 /ORGANISM="Pyramimonas sp., Strain CCMP2087" /LENGTH=234 /DNA_ID=CAMNT_0043877359 /DNA_START=180 /DNA_END=884 /DNA_ORIENTATION=+
MPTGIPMLRVEAEERYYEVEKMLGRDAGSVFPTESKPKGVDIKESVGAVKFVTEKQLEEIKASRGERVEDGTAAADKSLAQVLADNKAKKEEEFQEVWKSMKVGQNRPLDEEDCNFYDELAKNKWAADRTNKEVEQDELIAFKLARAEREVRAAPEPKPYDPSLMNPPPLTAKRKTSQITLHKIAKPKVAMVVKKAKPAPTVVPKVEKGSDSEGSGGGLFGLAGYGSSDDDSDK